jgi:hypothetical protein
MGLTLPEEGQPVDGLVPVSSKPNRLDISAVAAIAWRWQYSPQVEPAGETI